MDEFLMEQWIFVGRLIGAAICGGCKMESIKLAEENSVCVLMALLKTPDELETALLVMELRKKREVRRVFV